MFNLAPIYSARKSSNHKLSSSEPLCVSNITLILVTSRRLDKYPRSIFLSYFVWFWLKETCEFVLSFLLEEDLITYSNFCFFCISFPISAEFSVFFLSSVEVANRFVNFCFDNRIKFRKFCADLSLQQKVLLYARRKVLNSFLKSWP